MAKKSRTTNESWRNLNFTGFGDGNGLPPPGSHPARVGSFDTYEKEDVIWCVVTYMLRDYAETISEFAAVAAAPGSKHKNRVPNGLRVVYRLAKATGQKIDVAEPEELASLFIGKDVTLLVGHRKRDGVIELIVKGVLPPKTEG